MNGQPQRCSYGCSYGAFFLALFFGIPPNDEVRPSYSMMVRHVVRRLRELVTTGPGAQGASERRGAQSESMASGPSEEAAQDFVEVHKWYFDGADEHVGGMQSAVVGDVIHDEHVDYANFISIVGEKPRQMRVVVPANEADVTLGNERGQRYFWTASL